MLHSSAAYYDTLSSLFWTASHIAKFFTVSCFGVVHWWLLLKPRCPEHGIELYQHFRWAEPPFPFRRLFRSVHLYSQLRRKKELDQPYVSLPRRLDRGALVTFFGILAPGLQFQSATGVFLVPALYVSEGVRLFVSVGMLGLFSNQAIFLLLYRIKVLATFISWHLFWQHSSGLLSQIPLYGTAHFGRRKRPAVKVNTRVCP